MRVSSTPRRGRIGLRSRRAVTLLVMPAVIASTLSIAAADASHKPKRDKAAENADGFALDVGDSVFWDGPFIERAGAAPRALDGPTCDSPVAQMHACSLATVPWISGAAANLAGDDPLCPAEHPCFDYRLEIGAGGRRLRVALDHPSSRDWFALWLFDPDGTLVDAADNFEGYYSFEVAADNPAAGCCWTARVSAYDVRRSRFRMRAILEDAKAPETERRLLLPDLQMAPPFDLGFGDCQPTEIAHYGARSCLRFSAGPGNVGEGPLDLRVHDVLQTEGTMYQRVHSSDGSWQEREAGTYIWHTEHLHYHAQFFAGVELFRVIDEETGAVETAGVGRKLGNCPLDHFLADWSSFENDPNGTSQESPPYVCDPLGPHPATGVQMGITKGWGDIYDWYYEGNFVEFGSNPAGLYVVRIATDPHDRFLELDETDNYSYAYIEVGIDADGGPFVKDVFERGRGMSPWDPNKTLVDDGRRAERSLSSEEE